MSETLRFGPRLHTRQERLSLAKRLADASGEGVIAVAIYGSTAYRTDAPYSDLELFRIAGTQGEEHTEEWIQDGLKVELNHLSLDVYLRRALEVEPTWPLTHGMFRYAVAIRGELPALEELPPEPFEAAIRNLATTEVYEDVGKLRNAAGQREEGAIRMLAYEFARNGALLTALRHRYCFKSGIRMLDESIGLPLRPDGFDALALRLKRGDLADTEELTAAMERLWLGVCDWLA